MDFIDKLLPIIIALIWLFITFSGKKKKVHPQKPPQREKKSSQTPSFFDNLQKSVENILLENQQPVPFPVKTADIAGAEEKPVKKEKISRLEKIDEKKSVRSSDYASELNMKSKKENLKNIKRISTNRDISVKRLQEAIVWSEILAKPLSLRNDESIEY